MAKGKLFCRGMGREVVTSTLFSVTLWVIALRHKPRPVPPRTAPYRPVPPRPVPPRAAPPRTAPPRPAPPPTAPYRPAPPRTAPPRTAPPRTALPRPAPSYCQVSLITPWYQFYNPEWNRERHLESKVCYP